MTYDIVTRLRTVLAVPNGVDIWTTTALDAADEIVRLRALADQLAEALRDAHGTATRHAVCWCSTDSEYPSDCDSTIALAAHEAARKEARRG